MAGDTVGKVSKPQFSHARAALADHFFVSEQTITCKV